MLKTSKSPTEHIHHFQKGESGDMETICLNVHLTCLNKFLMCVCTYSSAISRIPYIVSQYHHIINLRNPSSPSPRGTPAGGRRGGGPGRGRSWPSGPSLPSCRSRATLTRYVYKQRWGPLKTISNYALSAGL